MPELSVPDGRIPTTFSRFLSDSDTLLTFPPFTSLDHVPRRGDDRTGMQSTFQGM